MGFLENIKAVPITDYAQRIGFQLVPKGKRYFSLKEHDSVMIDVEKNCFWRNSRFAQGYKGAAGSVIDFCLEFGEATSVKDAMKQIAALYGIEGEKEARVRFEAPRVPQGQQKHREYAKGNVQFPEKGTDNRCVFGYLVKTRKIEPSVIKYFFAKNMLYQDVHRNCVFHTGTVFGCVRGTDIARRFVGDLEGSDYNECFYFRGRNDSKTLVVAESVIDVMSVMSYFCKKNIRYVDYGYLALTGTTKIASVFYHLQKEKEDEKPYTRVLIATDSDEAGEVAASRIAEELDKMGIASERFAAPSGKDWNEYLTMQNN